MVNDKPYINSNEAYENKSDCVYRTTVTPHSKIMLNTSERPFRLHRLHRRVEQALPFCLIYNTPMRGQSLPV
jgi:hypothetical protein